MLVDEVVQDLSGRSNSAWAKKSAGQLQSISSARRNASCSRSNCFIACCASLIITPSRTPSPARTHAFDDGRRVAETRLDLSRDHVLNVGSAVFAGHARNHEFGLFLEAFHEQMYARAVGPRASVELVGKSLHVRNSLREHTDPGSDGLTSSKLPPRSICAIRSKSLVTS